MILGRPATLPLYVPLLRFPKPRATGIRTMGQMRVRHNLFNGRPWDTPMFELEHMAVKQFVWFS